MIVERTTKEPERARRYGNHKTGAKPPSGHRTGRKTPARSGSNNNLTKPESQIVAEQQRQIADLEMQVSALMNSREDLRERLESLEKSSNYYLDRFDLGPLGQIDFDPLGNILEHNRTLGDLLGAQKLLTLRGRFLPFVQSKDVPKFLNHLRRANSQDTPVHTELVLRNMDLKLIPVELISLRTTQRSEPNGVVLRTAVIDNTHRVVSEAALQKTQRNYQLLINAIDAIVWEAEPSLKKLHFVSSSAERCLGFPVAEWYRLGFWPDHIHVDDRERVLNVLSKAVDSRQEVIVEYRLLASNRQIIWMRDSISLVDIDGDLRVCGVAVNITHSKLTEFQLQEAHEHLENRVEARTNELRETVSDLEAFSYSLSHDMRAPLRAMQGYSQVLASTFGEQIGPSGRDYLRRIISSSERLDALIRDVLNYAKMSRAHFELVPINLDELLDGIIRDYPLFLKPHAEIQIEKPLHAVLGNRSFLTQCLSNLLSNAVKFVPEGKRPRVRIWTREDPAKVRIFVQDEGIGIRREDQDRIFGIFNRVYSAQKFEGTGIGLAIVKKAVLRMGGSVGVESRLGHGSRFWLELNRDPS